jgi:hypothetical protein
LTWKSALRNFGLVDKFLDFWSKVRFPLGKQRLEDVNKTWRRIAVSIVCWLSRLEKKVEGFSRISVV